MGRVRSLDHWVIIVCDFAHVAIAVVYSRLEHPAKTSMINETCKLFTETTVINVSLSGLSRYAFRQLCPQSIETRIYVGPHREGSKRTLAASSHCLLIITALTLEIKETDGRRDSLRSVLCVTSYLSLGLIGRSRRRVKMAYTLNYSTGFDTATNTETD